MTPARRGARSGKTFAHPNQLHLFGEAPPGVTPWAPPASFPRLHGPVVVDVETRDDGIAKNRGAGWATGAGEVVGVSITTADGTAGYYPFGHRGGGNLDPAHVLGWLRDELGKSDVTWICHNGLYDVGWLARYDVRPTGVWHDTQTMLALVDENRRQYSLDSGCKDYTTTSKDDSALVAWAKHWGVDPKQDLWRLPAAAVGAYAEQDGRATLALYEALAPLLPAQGLDEVYRLEQRVSRVLLAVRQRGIRVDIDRAEQLRLQFLREEADISEALSQLAGRTVECWNAESVAAAFTARGIEFPRTEDGAPSFRKEWLDAHPDPLAKQVRRWRTVNKMRTTFVEGSVLQLQHGGRIYPEFHSARSDDGGAVTGRMSCSSPNLQFFPGRDEEFAPLIRGLCLPEPGEAWHACDYSQQEPRLLVHFAALLNLPGAGEAARAYRDDPTTDFHQFAAELTGLKRKDAKAINLGLFYGMGGAKLCRSLGLPTVWEVNSRTGKRYEKAGPEGQLILAQYDARMPFVKAMYDLCQQLGESRGYIRTLAGRRRRAARPDYDRGAFPHKMLNALIQGSAADQTKYAMVACHEAGLTVLGQVHDELPLSAVPTPATHAQIRACMAECVPNLQVPFTVDIAVGDSWGAALD